MKKQFLLGLFVFGILTIGYAQSNQLEALLFELPDVIFKKLPSIDDNQLVYELNRLARYWKHPALRRI